MNPLPVKFFRILIDAFWGLYRFCAGRKRSAHLFNSKPMNQDIHLLERNLEKAIEGLEYWKREKANLLPFKDKRIEWGITSNEGAIKCFAYKLSNRIDELFPTLTLYAMISTDKELANKIQEYEVVLAFFQEYLQLERENLKNAQQKSLPQDILEFLNSRVEKLESNVDRYQTWITTFKAQIKKNEA